LASAPNDLVIDPFCGSGTTLEAAQRLGRKWLGIDASAGAVEVARGRLAAATKAGP
ncbi:MAG: DNA methyltransferase, partial [Thermoflexales bacterium]